MSGPSSEEPSGWRQPSPRDRRVGVALVVIVGMVVVVLVVGIFLASIALSLAWRT